MSGPSRSATRRERATKSSRDIVMVRSGAKPSWETASPSRTIAIRNGNDWLSLISIVRAHTLRSPALEDDEASGVTVGAEVGLRRTGGRGADLVDERAGPAVAFIAPTVWVRPSWLALAVSGKRKVRVSALLMPLPWKVVRSQRVAA